MAVDWEDILGAEGAGLAEEYDECVAEAIEHYNRLDGMAYLYDECVTASMAYHSSIRDCDPYPAE